LVIALLLRREAYAQDRSSLPENRLWTFEFTLLLESVGNS